MCWVSHDSSVAVVEGGEGATVATLSVNGLPLKTCVWVTESSLIAAGHDFVPMVFCHNADNTLAFVAKLDEPAKKGMSI